MPYASTVNLRGPVLRNLHEWMENFTMDMASYSPVLRASTTDPTLGTASVNQGRYIRFGYYMLYNMAYIFTGTASFSRGSGIYRLEYSSAFVLTAATPTDSHVTSGWGLHFQTQPATDTRYHAHPNDDIIHGTPDQHGFHHDDNSSGTTFDNAPNAFQDDDHISAFTSLPLAGKDTGHGEPL